MDATMNSAAEEFANLLNNLKLQSGSLGGNGVDSIVRLNKAAVQGDVKPFKHMVDAFGDDKRSVELVLNSWNKDGLLMFHMAAMGGSTDVIKYLLEEGNVNIDLKDGKAGRTALHIAIMCGYNGTTIFLLEKGASPNAETRLKPIPLHYAVEYGTKKTIMLLISKGSDVNAVADCGTPLQLAAAKNKRDAVEVLLENHANLNRKSHDFITPLIASILARSNECMKMLLKTGADPNIRGSIGRTSLGWAATLKDAANIIKYLLKYGAEPNVTDNLGMTPLEVAALEGCHMNVMVLFPVTSPIPKIFEWTIEGVMEYVQSNEANQERDGKLEEQIKLPTAGAADSLERRNYFKATQHYSEAIRYDPKNAVLMSEQSWCWASLKEGEFALTSAQSCLALRPQWPEAHFRVGEAYMVLKDFDNAAKAFLEGLKLDRNNEELKSAFRKALQGIKFHPITVCVFQIDSVGLVMYAA